MISLRISLGKCIAWRKPKKTEVSRFWNKFENILSAKRSCQDMYEIVRFLHKSLITEEPSIKENMKLSMEYFDSEVLIKQQEIVSFKISPSPPGQNYLQMLHLNMILHWRMLCVIKECCRIWQSHLFFVATFAFACKHVSSMRNFSY